MIKKLRVKLTAVSMLSLLLVLALILGAVNLINYRSITNDADATLAILAENGGRFPEQQGFGGPPPGSGPAPRFERDAELPFESRYFSVLIAEDGTSVAELTQIAAVDTNTACAYAEQALSSGKERGFLDRYRYAVAGEGTGKRVIFLDCARQLETFRTFLLAGIGISLAGFLLVFLLVAILSRRIIRPISESYEKQRRFITDAGHELKTPLTIIDADADVLAMDIGENEWLADIKAQTARLGNLTKNLIYLSRMEEDASSLARIEFPVSDVILEVAESFRAPALTGHKEFTVTAAPADPFAGDEPSIRQLVSILLDNAVKYSPEGGYIRLDAKKDGRALALTVENSTSEILPEDVSLLFDRFYRADPSRSSKSGGYGIGLAVAKAVAEAHGGTITADVPKPGSLRITVRLPLAAS